MRTPYTIDSIEITMKSIIPLTACGILFLGLACSQQYAIGDPTPAPGLEINGTVHSIRLPESEPELPNLAGRETVKVVCASCHTTRYIMIQPPLSKETWTAEVTKMQTAFSAPIPPEKVGEIVNYLVAVRRAVQK